MPTDTHTKALALVKARLAGASSRPPDNRAPLGSSLPRPDTARPTPNPARPEILEADAILRSLRDKAGADTLPQLQASIAFAVEQATAARALDTLTFEPDYLIPVTNPLEDVCPCDSHPTPKPPKPTIPEESLETSPLVSPRRYRLRRDLMVPSPTGLARPGNLEGDTLTRHYRVSKRVGVPLCAAHPDAGWLRFKVVTWAREIIAVWHDGQWIHPTALPKPTLPPNPTPTRPKRHTASERRAHQKARQAALESARANMRARYPALHNGTAKADWQGSVKPSPARPSPKRVGSTRRIPAPVANSLDILRATPVPSSTPTPNPNGIVYRRPKT